MDDETKGGGEGDGGEAMTAMIDCERVRLRSKVLRGVEAHAAAWRGLQPSPSLSSQLAVMVCDRGGCDVAWGRQLQSLGAGAALMRSPHEVSMVMQRALAETSCRVVLVDPELAPGVAAERRALLRFGSLVTRARAIVDGAAALWDALARELSYAEQQRRLDALVDAVAELAAREGPRPPILTPAVVRTRAALHARFAEELPLEELSALAGMSKCHLVHLFHREIGLPPHAYQIQLRVAHARALIAAGVALVDVATMTGFADQSHLTRLFKRVVGIPPGRYAALVAAEPPAAPRAALAL